jgi:hypothetical protein
LLVDEQLKDEYRDSLGRTTRSIAISDNGLIVVGFRANNNINHPNHETDDITRTNIWTDA